MGVGRGRHARSNCTGRAWADLPITETRALPVPVCSFVEARDDDSAGADGPLCSPPRGAREDPRSPGASDPASTLNMDFLFVVPRLGSPSRAQSQMAQARRSGYSAPPLTVDSRH